MAELTEDTDLLCAVRLGTTTAEPVLTTGADSVPIDELLSLNESVLEDVYPSRVPADPAPVPVLEPRPSPAPLPGQVRQSQRC